MRYRKLVLSLGVVALLASGRGWGQDDQATEQAMLKLLDSEPEKIFQLADDIQTHPYGPHAMAVMAVLTRYGVGSSKVTLMLGSLIKPFSTPAHRDVDLRLFGEYWTGLVVYAVEHDGRAGGTDASNMAAMNFMLKSYRIMLKDHPDAHNAYADQLGKLSAQGKLAAYVHQHVLLDKANPVKVEMGTPTPTPTPTPVVAPPESSSPSPEPTDPPMQTPDGRPTGQL